MYSLRATMLRCFYHTENTYGKKMEKMFDQNFAECMEIYTALAQYWLEKGRDSYLSRVRRFDNLEIEPGWTQSSWCLEFTESAVEETIKKKNRCSRTYTSQAPANTLSLYSSLAWLARPRERSKSFMEVVALEDTEGTCQQ
ncbi:predicted protein [Botrytis cinerea T4]|uniref:Uncharacterized protein n=1 Tax=Botryotinia fuckeliana (strain T4) TaxID=999810 RepID=G2YR50_BOTF4|nr:predicted protein [Botrytis cinerea T4]